MEVLHIIGLGIMWFLIFVYFAIPAFITYYVPGNIGKKLVLGLGALLFQSALVIGAWYLATKNGGGGQFGFLVSLMYGLAMSFLGVLGALISLVVDRVRQVR